MNITALSLNDIAAGTGVMNWVKNRFKSWRKVDGQDSPEQVVEMSEDERWRLRVDQDWIEFPDYMDELKKHGCDFGLDNVTGAYHIPTEPNGACGICVYNTYPELGVWSIGGHDGEKWEHTYDIKDIGTFRRTLRHYISTCRSE